MAVHHWRARKHAHADGADEVGAVGESDNLPAALEPQGGSDTGDGLDDSAVDPSVHDAAGLVQRRGHVDLGVHRIAVRVRQRQAQPLGEAVGVAGELVNHPSS